MRWLFIVGLVTLSFVSHGEIYKWVDDKGQVHFSSSPPPSVSASPYETDLEKADRIREAKKRLSIARPANPFSGDSSAEAVDRFEKTLPLAKTGDGRAIWELAIMFIYGHGTEKNVDMALVALRALPGYGISHALKAAIYGGAFDDEYIDLDKALAAAEEGAKLDDPNSIAIAFQLHANLAVDSFGNNAESDPEQALTDIRHARELYTRLSDSEKDLRRSVDQELAKLEDTAAARLAREKAAQVASTWWSAPESAPVKNSAWDGSVLGVKRYLDNTLHDADSFDAVSWSKVQTNGQLYRVSLKYRAKNAFGAYRLATQMFLLDSAGNVLSVSDFGD